MNEDINESAADQGAPSVRHAAMRVLGWIDAGCDPSKKSIEALRQALAAERSNMPAIPGAELAAEGVELIKAGGQISAEHIRAIVQAAEWAFEAADANALKWDADMRAIKLWQGEAEPFDAGVARLAGVVDAFRILERDAGLGLTESAIKNLAELAASKLGFGMVVTRDGRTAAVKPGPVRRELIWPDHADLTLWLLELIEHRPPCPSINDVAALIGDLRKFAASVLMQRAADQLEEMANALVASSRRTVHAEAVRDQLVEQLRRDRVIQARAVEIVTADDEARGRPRLVEGGGGAATDGQAFAYRVGVCRICGCTEANACAVLVGELDEDGAPEDVRPCGWADATHTLCDNPSCVEQAGVDGARAAYEDGPTELGSACEEPIVYDSLRVVFGRPDVQEAIAKAVAAQRGADWQEATEAGRNAFREEAAGLLRVAVAQPK